MYAYGYDGGISKRDLYTVKTRGCDEWASEQMYEKEHGRVWKDNDLGGTCDTLTLIYDARIKGKTEITVKKNGKFIHKANLKFPEDLVVYPAIQFGGYKGQYFETLLE